MPLPILPMMLGIGALLFLTSSSDKPKKGVAPANPPTPGGPPDFPFGDCLDASMTPTMKAQVNELLLTLSDPAQLDTAAAAAVAGGFPKAAACLKKKADGLRGSVPPGGDGPPPGPAYNPVTVLNMPFRVRAGDFPYALAQYYTGQGARYSELGPLNPQLGPFASVLIDDPNGNEWGADGKPKSRVSNYANWDKGPAILLPASWSPRARNLPVPGTQTASDQPANPPLVGAWPPVA